MVQPNDLKLGSKVDKGKTTSNLMLIIFGFNTFESVKIVFSSISLEKYLHFDFF